MDKKYKVTQKFMDKLIEWRAEFELDAQTGWPEMFVDGNSIDNFPEVVEYWRGWNDHDNPIECNNRLIAIIQWLNGEDVFEVE